MGFSTPPVQFRSDERSLCFPHTQFFIIFNFWALLFCSFTFSTLVGLTARSTVRNWPQFGIDPQKIAVIVLYVPPSPPLPFLSPPSRQLK